MYILERLNNFLKVTLLTRCDLRFELGLPTRASLTFQYSSEPRSKARKTLILSPTLLALQVKTPTLRGEGKMAAEFLEGGGGVVISLWKCAG